MVPYELLGGVGCSPPSSRPRRTTPLFRAPRSGTSMPAWSHISVNTYLFKALRCLHSKEYVLHVTEHFQNVYAKFCECCAALQDAVVEQELNTCVSFQSYRTPFTFNLLLFLPTLPYVHAGMDAFMVIVVRPCRHAHRIPIHAGMDTLSHPCRHGHHQRRSQY